MIILGLNAYHPDSSACILCDGQLVAAVEEERFTRIKHWAGLPLQSIRFCLREANVKPSEISHIAVNRKPWANLWPKAKFAWQTSAWRGRAKNLTRITHLHADLQRYLDAVIPAKLHYIEHHHAHCASAFLCSPFPSATIVSVDGTGDFSTAAWARGSGSHITMYERLRYPHSLGFFYLAMTQYLGFNTYGDEYKVMGLAATGKPRYVDQVRQLMTFLPYAGIELNLRAFTHHTASSAMTWASGQPVIGQLYSPLLSQILSAGPKDADLAASVQVVYEEALDHLLTGTDRHALCLAGGCALNSVANGKLLKRYAHLYIPSVPHDAGGALGAALVVWCERLGHPRRFLLDRADWGPSFAPTQIDAAIGRHHTALGAAVQSVRTYQDYRELLTATCKHLDAGCIVGWFQGRAEFGPRALGYRSILADPRKAEMKDRINQKIKHREPFRPFAPAVLEEKAQDWFELNQPSPFMSLTVPVKMEKRDKIPAVTHTDGSARPQTVSRHTNALFWELLSYWEMRSGMPVLLNTSFNDHREPLVNTPDEAIQMFCRTELDVLVVGNWILTKKPSIVP